MMDLVWELLQSGWGLLLFAFPLIWRHCRRWIKRGFAWLLNVAMRMMMWVVAAKLLLTTLRTIGATLKIANTPQMRAYVIVSMHTALLNAATDIVKRPTTSMKVVNTIKEIEDILNPVIRDYAEAILIQPNHA